MKLQLTFRSLKQAERLESRFHSLCKDVFYDLELPYNAAEPYHEGLKEELKRSGFISKREALGDFPLLLSGTPSSRCILMALAENIIGTQLTTGIFRLVPLPLDTSLSTVEYLENISRQLSSRSWDNEARWRSICCTAVEADFEANDHVVNMMLDRLRSVFKPLFKADIPALDSLMAQLNDLFREATLFWRRVQHSARKVVPDMHLDEDDSAYHAEHDAMAVADDVFRTDNPSGPMPLPLFPKFSVVDADGRHIVFRGKGLAPTAPAAVLARSENAEYKKMQAARYAASLTRSTSQRRRQSVSSTPSTVGSAPRSPASVRAPASSASVAGGGVAVAEGER